jgi:beta-galactosidase
LMVRTVGSGTNGLGFYMYHGGTTPSVGNFFLAEGSGLNNKSYDYQAPVGEFGKVSSGFYSLKLINYFLKSYGDDLAPLYPVLPATNDSIKANNTNTLRYAIRSDGNKGYLFMHNYQDHLVTTDMQGLKINIATKSGDVTFPRNGTFTLKAGSSAIFPFNMNIDGVDINMATVQPFCRFTNNGKKYKVFVSIDGISPEMVFKGKVKVSGIKSSVQGGNTVVSLPVGKMSEIQVNGASFLVLPYCQALNAYLVGGNDKHLIISKALVLDNEQNISLVSSDGESVELSVYPAVNELSATDASVVKLKSTVKNVSQWQMNIPKVESSIQLVKADDRHFVLKAPNVDWTKVNDIFISFDYRGDRGICMMNGELQTDNLYTSKP